MSAIVVLGDQADIYEFFDNHVKKPDKNDQPKYVCHDLKNPEEYGCQYEVGVVVFF